MSAVDQQRAVALRAGWLRATCRLALAAVTVVTAVGGAVAPVGAGRSTVTGPAASSAQQAARWERWLHLDGAVDVGGPRRDGALVAVGAGRLSLVSPGGDQSPYATGPDGFAGSPDFELYFVVVPAAPSPEVGAAQAGAPPGCSFVPDDVYILDLGGAPGLIRVDGAGRAARFAATPDVDLLYGIALDTTGRFGGRLLVGGARNGRTTVFAVDCAGGVSVIARDLPFVEGGFAVAPETFGAFSGMLITPDEVGGQLWAIAPDGTSAPLLAPEALGLPAGPDTGAESLGFVPPGFLSIGGSAYLADRVSPDNPFPGTDSVLRLSAASLAAAGVREGDLLVATEGGGVTAAVRCGQTCTAMRVAEGPPTGHIEGKIAFAPG